MEYYAATKRNVLILATPWMNLKGIRLSKESLKRNILNDSIYMTQLRRHNYSDGKQMVARVGEGYGYKK